MPAIQNRLHRYDTRFSCTHSLFEQFCPRDTLLEQSSFMCISDFMGTIDPREQNFHPAKCSMILNRLNIREQDPGAN